MSTVNQYDKFLPGTPNMKLEQNTKKSMEKKDVTN